MAVAEDHGDLHLEPPRTYYEDVVKLPGYGHPPDRCRGLTPVGFCEDGHTVLGRSSCGTRYCPDHWRDWCEDAVIAVVARLAAYREAVDGAEKRCSHVVASPPQDRRYSVRSLWETRSEAYDVLEDAGVRGAVTVTHPYATNERGDTLFESARDAGSLEDGMGKWAFLRDATEGWNDLTRYIEARPHYHTLAMAEDVRSEDAPDGWVVERIRTMQPFHKWDSDAYRDMAATVYYVLTHGGVQDGRQLVTYFGEVHPAAFDPEEELTATMWDRIQHEAEKAVKAYPEEEGSGSAGPDECPQEECEAVVRDLVHLEEYLNDEEWVASVRSGDGGRELWLRLRGAFVWWDGRTDRPPPSVAQSRKKFRAWLVERGEVMTPRRSQVSLATAVMSERSVPGAPY